MHRRSWVEINLHHLKNNWEILNKLIPDNTKIMSVVKADAYGHGAIEVSKTLQEAGCKDFAVSNIDEAIELRSAGIDGQILILGYTPAEYVNELVKYDITQAILDEYYLEKLISQQNRNLKCQFAIDTGMNRIGLDSLDLDGSIKAIRRAYDNLKLNGIFSHLCVADTFDAESLSFTSKQIAEFKNVLKAVDIKLEYTHILNSAGMLWHYDEISNLARAGIILYGLKPDYLNSLPEGLKPILTWKSVVTVVKMVKKGESIGYGRTFIAKQDIKVATITTGYADGYSRALSNKGYVYIDGHKCPIVGRVCMDQFMVDVSDLDVRPGQEAELLNEQFNGDDMAKLIGTISYEVTCNISKRVDRIFIK